MQFRTQIPISKNNSPIDYNSKIISFGSCFVENMAEKFEYYKFQNYVNPFGIIFNSISIENILKRIVEKDVFTEKDVFFHNELWHCFEIHSELSNTSKEDLLKNLNQLIETSRLKISEATHLILTLGTSWVYRNTESDKIVANCHKVPQKRFTKELLSTEKVIDSIASIKSLLASINGDLKIVLTVSPVRHSKDGFVENNVSKSHLLSAVFQSVNNDASAMSYFPSYEIMTDELRDYRFYAADMLHPNQLAIDYIWSRFFENYIHSDCFTIMEEVSSIQKALSHRPFNPKSESHLKFLTAIDEKIKNLQRQLPFINFSV